MNDIKKVDGPMYVSVSVSMWQFEIEQKKERNSIQKMCYFEIMLILQGFVIIYLLYMYCNGSSLRQKSGINGKS